MSRSKRLTKEAREVIEQTIRDSGEISTDDALAIVEQHYMSDPKAEKRSAMLRVVNQIIRGIKGETGKRSCFNLKGVSDSRYIDVATTTSISSLDGIEKQLDRQFYGINESKKQINNRRQILRSSRRSEEVGE